VHGRVAAEDRETTMVDFAARRIDVLAATTVIEVGVDVPNASYLVVENAERFGLAQLHQLRGRVGRGSRPSRAVFLLGEGATEESRGRLEVLARTEDGFAIAEEDLRRRGPGDALGTRQSGVPFFRVGDLIRDLALLRKAREEAERLQVSGGDAAFEERLFFRGGEIPESD
jgi:ATP-dependent DNA helicase RecG